MINFKKSHPPQWLENSKLFRKLYALRRVLHYQRPRWFSSTDEKIAWKFNEDNLNIDRGFFVDVGCFHPCQQNVTYRLYRKGWRGINIDLDDVKIEAFRIKRPKDINIACGVSNRKGSLEFYKKSFWSMFNSFEKAALARKSRSDSREWRKVVTKTDTLTNIIDSTVYKDRPIDFLSVDVEGHDLPVLESLDFDRYKPKVICVELDGSWVSSITDVQASELYGFLTSKGYILFNWISGNLMFERKDHMQVKHIFPSQFNIK